MPIIKIINTIAFPGNAELIYSNSGRNRQLICEIRTSICLQPENKTALPHSSCCTEEHAVNETDMTSALLRSGVKTDTAAQVIEFPYRGDKVI